MLFTFFGGNSCSASFLKEDPQTDMFKLKYPFLEFGELEALEMDVGIDDARWLKNEAEEDANLLRQDSIDDLPLFMQSNET